MQTPHTLWHRHYTEIRSILRLSIPVAAGLLLNRMIPFISVVFVGHLGPAELAAASLGSSLSNILGLAVMAGLAGAITTLSGQVNNFYLSLVTCKLKSNQAAALLACQWQRQGFSFLLVHWGAGCLSTACFLSRCHALPWN